MKWTEALIDRIKRLFPKPRGTVEIDHLTFLQALQYIAENGCRWRSLPETFGKWGTIYQRFRRWIALGIFELIEKEFQSHAIAVKGIKALALDSTYVKVHPDGAGASKKKDCNLSARAVPVGRSKSMPSSRILICRLCVVYHRARRQMILLVNR
jgi:transposase